MATATSPYFQTIFNVLHIDKAYKFSGILYEVPSSQTTIVLEEKPYLVDGPPIDEFKPDGVLKRNYKLIPL